MNHSQLKEIKSNPEVVLNRLGSNSPVDNEDDDDIFTKTESHNDHQAQMRRRVPTRHSIKSRSSRKTSTKQTTTNEVRMKVSSVFSLIRNSPCFMTFVVVT